MGEWAVFDVDGTLLPGTSMEMIFINELLKQRKIHFTTMAAFVFSIIKTVARREGMGAIHRNKGYLKGLDAKQITAESENIFQHRIVNRLSQKGIDEVKKYKDMGYGILIMSGSPDFLTLQLQEIYNPDHIVATTPEIIGGLYTGEIVGPHPFGKRKSEILVNLKRALDMDFDKSIAFANHHADIDHLRLFKTSVAVNPSNRLKTAAMKNGWRIDSWL
jgi:HAD superfamily phosphoserine phosphatase-like hydrolase